MANKSLSVCRVENGKFYLLDSDNITPIDKTKASKNFCALFIQPEELISHTITLPTDIDEDKFHPSVEIALFESDKLDIKNRYTIDYKKNLSDDNDLWVVETFAVDEERLFDLYGDILEHLGHIDLIAVPYLVYEAYFSQIGVEKRGIRLVVKIDEKHSFIALHKNGIFIGYQKIYSLEYISKKSGILLSKLIDILQEKGLDESRYDESQKSIYNVIYLIFLDIMRQMERLLRSKSAYFDISVIESIILDFDDYDIVGFAQILKEYGFEVNNVERLKVKESIYAPSQYEYLKNIYLKLAVKGVIDAPNLSPFKRQPPIYKRWIGISIIVLVITILLNISYGIYMEYRYTQLSYENALLRSRLQKIHKKVKVYKESIKKSKTILKDERQKIFQTKNSIINFKRAVSKLADIKTKTLISQNMLRDVNIVMKKYSIMCSSLEQNNSRVLAVDLIVPYDKRDNIASFMKDMKIKGYKSVATDEIILDKDLYRSSVKIIK